MDLVPNRRSCVTSSSVSVPPTLTWVSKIDSDPANAQVRIAIAAETLRTSSSSLGEDDWKEGEEEGEEAPDGA